MEVLIPLHIKWKKAVLPSPLFHLRILAAVQLAVAVWALADRQVLAIAATSAMVQAGKCVSHGVETRPRPNGVTNVTSA